MKDPTESDCGIRVIALGVRNSISSGSEAQWEMIATDGAGWVDGGEIKRKIIIIIIKQSEISLQLLHPVSKLLLSASSPVLRRHFQSPGRKLNYEILFFFH